MLRPALLAFALVIPGLLFAGDEPAKQDTSKAANGLPCSDIQKHFPPCGLPQAEVKKARKLYERASQLAKNNQLEQALTTIREARTVSPQDAMYAAVEKAIGGRIVTDQMRQGDQAMQRGDTTAALTAFKRAAEIDPTNDYALQRLNDALPPPEEAGSLRMREELGELRLKPSAGLQSFEYRGNSAEFLKQFTRAYGITAVPDEGLAQRRVRVNLDNVSWEHGAEIVGRVCKVLLIPMSEHEVLVANDTEENRRDLTRMSLRTFYVIGDSSPQELNDLMTALRVLFDLRFITLNATSGAIVVRAPQKTMDAVSQFLSYLREDRPTVVLEVKIFDISTSFTRDLGTSVPTQFSVFNVTSEISSLVSSSAYSQIVAALQAAGQPVNAQTILAGLLASASSLGGTSSPLSQPFATFGGGLTLSGVTIPSTALNFSLNNSMTRTVDDVMLRAGHGKAATLKVGERYPIVSSQFSATSATSSLLSSLGINSSAGTAAIPSPQFSYEDIGLVFKATPQVHGKLVSLNYELTLRSLGAIQLNGLPLLTNQELKGTISTNDGEAVVMAGLVDSELMASINGIPMLSLIPGLGTAFSTQTKTKTYDELLVVVTPHISAGSAGTGSYIPIPMNGPK